MLRTAYCVLRIGFLPANLNSIVRFVGAVKDRLYRGSVQDFRRARCNALATCHSTGENLSC
jgi:hypothetical protein